MAEPNNGETDLIGQPEAEATASDYLAEEVKTRAANYFHVGSYQRAYQEHVERAAMCRAAVAELSRLRAVVEEQRWIPVSERLPDADPHSAIVLACSDRGTVRGAYMIWGKTWVWDEFDSPAERGPTVVAWMPMPEPFKTPNPTTGAE